MEVKDKIVNSIQQIITALDTVEVASYKNMKTMCNCVEALSALHGALQSVDIIEHEINKDNLSE